MNRNRTSIVFILRESAANQLQRWNKWADNVRHGPLRQSHDSVSAAHMDHSSSPHTESMGQNSRLQWALVRPSHPYQRKCSVRGWREVGDSRLEVAQKSSVTSADKHFGPPDAQYSFACASLLVLRHQSKATCKRLK